jgi:hypothetical protein
LFSQMIPGWLYPDTDFITSFAPFNNLPTQYPITIEGEQKWFAQWAFESLAVCWLFPGKTIRVDSTCLDCGLPMRVDIQDGILRHVEPESIVGYVAVPFWRWYENIGHAWSTMNFFRSEEHVRNWVHFNPATENGIISVADLHRLFSCEHLRRRLDPDFISKRPILRQELLDTLKNMNLGPFWEIP